MTYLVAPGALLFEMWACGLLVAFAAAAMAIANLHIDLLEAYRHLARRLAVVSLLVAGAFCNKSRVKTASRVLQEWSRKPPQSEHS